MYETDLGLSPTHMGLKEWKQVLRLPFVLFLYYP